MMARNRFLLLAAATLIAIGLVLLLDRSPTGPEDDGAAGPVVPGLADRVNAVEAIDVVAPGGATTVRLRRENERWRVLERDGYEADFRQVVELLRSLAEAERAEPRTANPDWYDRLGVADPGTDGATGRRVEFPGENLPAVIVGQVDPTESGSYVRAPDEAQAWLADRVIEVVVDPVAWLEPGIMDIPAEDLAEVTVTHADGGTVRLQKAGDGGDWVLRDIPDGRSAGPDWQREALANALRGLSLDDVRRFVPPHPDGATRTEFRTEDGLIFTATTWRETNEQDAETAWVHFTVDVVEDVAADGIETTTGGEGDAPVDAGVGSDADADADAADPAADRLANAVAVDARLSPWAFRIPIARADDLAPRIDELLEPIEREEAD